jgi:hypothetical protein
LDIREAAHRLARLGYHLVPIAFGSKVPLVKWKESECSGQLIDAWFDQFDTGINIAIEAGKSRIIVLDADSDSAVSWIEHYCPPTLMRAATPRGGLHAYFRAPADHPPPATDLFRIGLDVRSRASLVIASPSWSHECQRAWRWQGPILAPRELPLLPQTTRRIRPIEVRLPPSPRAISE